jgi:hypothetical protein
LPLAEWRAYGALHSAFEKTALMFLDNADFYPTPRHFTDRMLDGAEK